MTMATAYLYQSKAAKGISIKAHDLCITHRGMQARYKHDLDMQGLAKTLRLCTSLMQSVQMVFQATAIIDLGPHAKLKKDILARHVCGGWPDVSPGSGSLAPDLVRHPPEAGSVMSEQGCACSSAQCSHLLEELVAGSNLNREQNMQHFLCCDAGPGSSMRVS